MLNVLFPLLIGVLLGFLAGMGVGGGSLLLLWLTQVVMLAQPQARILNLLFYLPAALVATLFRLRHKAIAAELAVPGLIGGCLGAALFSIIGRGLDMDLGKKLLGGLLILIGLREVFYRRKAR